MVGNGNLLQYSCLETSIDRGAWWATVHGVTENWTWLSNWACTHKRELLYSSRNSAQCSLVTLTARNSKKEGYMYMFSWFTLLAVETNTTLQSNYTPIKNFLKRKTKLKKKKTKIQHLAQKMNSTTVLDMILKQPFIWLLLCPRAVWEQSCLPRNLVGCVHIMSSNPGQGHQEYIMGKR